MQLISPRPYQMMTSEHPRLVSWFVEAAGLGVLEGPLHGAASGLAHRMLAEVAGARQRRPRSSPTICGRARRVPGPRPPALPGRGPARPGPVRRYSEQFPGRPRALGRRP